MAANAAARQPENFSHSQKALSEAGWFFSSDINGLLARER
jgi:hypothetical protein